MQDDKQMESLKSLCVLSRKTCWVVNKSFLIIVDREGVSYFALGIRVQGMDIHPVVNAKIT